MFREDWGKLAGPNHTTLLMSLDSGGNQGDISR